MLGRVVRTILVDVLVLLGILVVTWLMATPPYGTLMSFAVLFGFAARFDYHYYRTHVYRCSDCGHIFRPSLVVAIAISGPIAFIVAPSHPALLFLAVVVAIMIGHDVVLNVFREE